MNSHTMTAADLKRLLNLQPHPREGGWYARNYESGEFVGAAAYPPGRYPGPRRTGTAIYYLLEPDTFSEMHRLRSDEVFHFYGGDPVEMLQLPGSSDPAAQIGHDQPREPATLGQHILLGSDLLAGHRLQVPVSRGVWQGSRLLAGGRWALLGCTVSPGFEFEDYEDVSRDYLLERWPEWHTLITALTRA